MKKLTIIAALAMATAAFAIPSTASAIWTDNHKHIPENVNPEIHGQGNVGFESEAGSIECTNVTNTIQLTGGQTTGHVTEFNAIEPQACHTIGALGHCTLTSVVPTGLPWLAHVNQAQTGVTVTGVHIHNDLHGFLCPDLTIHLNDPMDFVELTGEDGPLAAETNQHTTIQGLDIEGTVTSTPIGTVKATGTINPAALQNKRYGWT